MTKTEFEVAKIYEEELLHCLRNAERMKSKMMKILDDGNGALLDIGYNDKILPFGGHGGGLRDSYVRSLDCVRTQGGIGGR